MTSVNTRLVIFHRRSNQKDPIAFTRPETDDQNNLLLLHPPKPDSKSFPDQTWHSYTSFWNDSIKRYIGNKPTDDPIKRIRSPLPDLKRTTRTISFHYTHKSRVPSCSDRIVPDVGIKECTNWFRGRSSIPLFPVQDWYFLVVGDVVVRGDENGLDIPWGVWTSQQGYSGGHSIDINM
jgi:hypothetical protein